MAQYRVLRTSFINNVIVEAGQIIDFDGEASDNLEAIKGKRSKAAVEPSVDEFSGQPTTDNGDGLV